MKIYTKTGDTGETSLFGGKHTPKSSLRIEAYGTVDELNAQLGIVRALKPSLEIDSILERLQNQLFILGADLAATSDIVTIKVQRIQEASIHKLEEIIDRIEAQLVQLDSFILPGGSLVSAQLQVARAVCRRAERVVDALGRKEEVGYLPLVFLNRLSDLLFVLARYENKITNIEESKVDFE